MSIDIPTMVLMVAFLQILSGALLIAASFYYRDEPAGFWWGASHITLAGGVALSIVGGIMSADRIMAFAFVAFLTCAAMQWHGTRLLTGARSYFGAIFIGPVLIAVVNLLPVGEALPMVRGIAASVLNLSYFAAALYVLVRPPGEKLVAYTPLAVLFAANIVAIGLGPFGGLGSSETGLPPLLSIGGMIYVEAQFFVIGTTLFVVAAMRERKERLSRTAATIDPLTGLANRREFFEHGERLVQRCEADETPFGVLMIDLDGFKSVNDRFGHAVGDKVLMKFTEIAIKALRPSDVLARIGGEEFAAILPGSGIEAAAAIAERIRLAFQSAAIAIDGQPVNATLCVGVATTYPGATLDDILRDADAALYSAKHKGRNRVEIAKTGMATAPSQVTRIA